MPTVEKTFEVRCEACGRYLERETSVEGTDINTVLEIEPCPECLKGMKDDGYAEGYEDGHEKGYDNGYDEGYKAAKAEAEE